MVAAACPPQCGSVAHAPLLVAAALLIALLSATVAIALERRHRRLLAGSRDALRASESRLRAIFEHAAVGIALYHEDGHILEANPAFTDIVGYSRDDLCAMTAADLSPLEEVLRTRAKVQAVQLGTCDRVTLEKYVRRKDGALRLCALTISRVDGLADGRPGLVRMMQDVTDHRTIEAQLVYRAYHDALTGLANRARLQERADEALAAAAGGSSVALLLIDLDGFKLVNDSAGHAAGDALLREVAGRLLHATRGADLVARLGGDEFAVLLAGVDGDGPAVAVAERVIAGLARPFTIGGARVVIGASVGVARGEPAAVPAPSADDVPAAPPAISPFDAMLRDADLALYEAKARGRGRCVPFAPAMRAAFDERVALERALRRGLDAGEFRLVYQPIVDLATGRLSGMEALVRWHHPRRGVVSPAAFIPVAEETGLIHRLGGWVLGEACRQGAAWAAEGRDQFSLTVNVSGPQLQEAGFVAEVRDVLAATGFPADRLVLELTESSVIQQPEVARARMAALRALGVRLAIDDFGTGYSALSYLRHFPIDVLKIDKSFIDPIATDERAAAIASAIVTLGTALRLRTVAEGVESAEQAATLGAMGCGMAQGYLYCRPVSAEEVAAWCDRRAGLMPALERHARREAA